MSPLQLELFSQDVVDRHGGNIITVLFQLPLGLPDGSPSLPLHASNDAHCVSAQLASSPTPSPPGFGSRFLVLQHLEVVRIACARKLLRNLQQ